MRKNSELITFTPAQLYEGKEWFVGYYANNPATNKLERKRIRINYINPISERRKYAKKLINDINEKLYHGWNPFLEVNASRGYTKLVDAMDTFMNVKNRELRADSKRSYQSYIDTLKKWLESKNKSDVFCVDFKKIDAVDFLDDRYMSGKISSRTFNNYKLFFNTLWLWLQEKQYVSDNVFANIKKKMEESKNRTVIMPEKRVEIMEYLQTKDTLFGMVCQFVFHTLLRPKEISYMKPEWFNFKNQTITVPAYVAKNKQSRIITIPNVFMEKLAFWDFNGAKYDEYVFGTNFKPGKTPVNPRRFSKKWDDLRDKLGLSMEEKLYSLRDSGIVQLLQDGISPEEVMKQADHSSLEITTIYAKHINPTGSAQIKQKASGF